MDDDYAPPKCDCSLSNPFKAHGGDPAKCSVHGSGGGGISEPVFFHYDPRPISEQEAEENARWERLAREGGVVVDEHGAVVATLTPTDPPTPPPILRFHVGPPESIA